MLSLTDRNPKHEQTETSHRIYPSFHDSAGCSNRGSPDKNEVCRNDEDLQDPALRHCSFRWLLFKRRVAERSKNSIQSNASRNTDRRHLVLWCRQRLRCHSIRRCRLSVFSIAHRRVAVNRCQWLVHRHLSTA